MAKLEYFQYAYMSDNYGVLIHAPQSGETASIDCGDADAAVDALKQKNWSLTHILATHHHADHCLLYTSPSPRDATLSRMPSSA